MNQTDFTNAWTRIDYVRQNAVHADGSCAFGSINSMTFTLGIKRCDELYRIKRGEDVSEKVASAINRVCPSCSVEWLLTGSGEPPLSPIVTVLPAMVKPYWPLDYPQPGSNAATIVGRWQFVESEICNPSVQHPCWRKVQNDNIITVIYDFKNNAKVDRLDGDTKYKTFSYGYDPHSGTLVIDCYTKMIVSLTDSRMICLDRSNLAQGFISKEYYKRL